MRPDFAKTCLLGLACVLSCAMWLLAMPVRAGPAPLTPAQREVLRGRIAAWEALPPASRNEMRRQMQSWLLLPPLQQACLIYTSSAPASAVNPTIPLTGRVGHRGNHRPRAAATRAPPTPARRRCRPSRGHRKAPAGGARHRPVPPRGPGAARNRTRSAAGRAGRAGAQALSLIHI